MRALVLAPFVPRPADDGGKLRVARLVEHAQGHSEVRLLCLATPDQEQQAERLRAEGWNIRTVPWAPDRRAAAARAVLRGTSFYAALTATPAFTDAVVEEIQAGVDVVQAEYSFMGAYRFEVSQRLEAASPPWVLDEHNVEWRLTSRLGDNRRRLSDLPYRLYAAREARRRAAEELWAVSSADAVLAVSDVDAALLREAAPGTRVLVVPNGCDLRRTRTEERSRSGALFVGKMDYRPNAEGVAWYVREVLPRLSCAAGLTVVGGSPGPTVTALAADPRVAVTGLVPDVEPYLAAAAVAVVPLLAGSGTRLKVLEALASGVPLVTTSAGCEGVEVVDGVSGLVADTPEAFARAVDAVIRDPDLRRRLVTGGRELAARYAWDRVAQPMIALWKELAAAAPPPAQPVSIAATVRNEVADLDRWLDALLAQSQAPDEVVVVDGGSTDGTWEALRRRAADDRRVTALSLPGSTIAQGRNAAVRAARNEVIAVTDAGVRLPTHWLRTLTRPLLLDEQVGMAAGFFVPGGSDRFDRLLAVLTLPHPDEVDPRTFLPSARSTAFRRATFEEAGGYPEWLAHCEDVVFDLDVRRRGVPIAFTPLAAASWDARPTLRAFFRQYRLYARGDGHALLFGRRHALRYAAYATGLVGLALSHRRPAVLAPLAVGGAAYLSHSYRRLLRRPPTRGLELAAAAALVPVVVATGDIAKMLGYLYGRWQRERGVVVPHGRSGQRP